MLEKTNNSEPLNRFNKKCQVNINYRRGILLPSAQTFLLLTLIYQRFNTIKSLKILSQSVQFESASVIDFDMIEFFHKKFYRKD